MIEPGPERRSGQAESGRAEPDLMSLVTHELRLPLTSIKGYTHLLRREMAGPLNEQQKQFIGDSTG